MARIRKPTRARFDGEQSTGKVNSNGDSSHERSAALIAQRNGVDSGLTLEEHNKVKAGRICATYRKPLFVVHNLWSNNIPGHALRTSGSVHPSVIRAAARDQNSQNVASGLVHNNVATEEQRRSDAFVAWLDRKFAQEAREYRKVEIGPQNVLQQFSENWHKESDKDSGPKNEDPQNSNDSGWETRDVTGAASSKTTLKNVDSKEVRPQRKAKPATEGSISAIQPEAPSSTSQLEPSLRLDLDQQLRERFAPDKAAPSHNSKPTEKRLNPRDLEHYTEVYGQSPPDHLSSLEILADYQPDHELPPPFAEDASSTNSDFEDEADELLHARYRPLTDAQEFIRILNQPLSWRSRDALYALAENTQYALRAWQEEYLSLDQRTAIRSNPVKKPATGARIPMDPAIYDDMKEADLHGYIYDSRKPPGTQDPYRQKPDAPDITNGRELRTRRGKDVGQDATDDDGHASESNRRVRRAVQRYDGEAHASSRGRKRAHEPEAGDLLETPRKRARPAASRNSSFGPAPKHQTLKINLGSYLREESLQPGTATESESRMGTPDANSRRRGRPPGSKNLAPRSDAGIKKGPRKNKVVSQDSDLEYGDLIEELDEGDPMPGLPEAPSPRIEVQDRSLGHLEDSRQSIPLMDEPNGARDSPAPAGGQKERKPRAKSEKRSESMQKWWAARKVKLGEAKKRQEEEREAEVAKHAPAKSRIAVLNMPMSSPGSRYITHERQFDQGNGHQPFPAPQSRRVLSPESSDAPRNAQRTPVEYYAVRHEQERFAPYIEPSSADGSLRNPWPEARPSGQRPIDSRGRHLPEPPHHSHQETPRDLRPHQQFSGAAESHRSHHSRQWSHNSGNYDPDRRPPPQWTHPHDSKHPATQQHQLPHHVQYSQRSPDRRSQTLPSPHLNHVALPPPPPLPPGPRGFTHQVGGPPMGPPTEQWQHHRRPSAQGPSNTEHTRGYPPSNANMHPQGSPLPPPPPGYMYGPPITQGPPLQPQYHQQAPPQQRPPPPLSPRDQSQSYYPNHALPPHQIPYPAGPQSPPMYSRQQGPPPPPPLLERPRGYSQSSSHGPPPPLNTAPGPDRFIHQAPGPPPQLPQPTAPFQGFSHTFAPAPPPPPNSYPEASQSQHKRNKSSGQTYQFIAPAGPPAPPAGRPHYQSLDFGYSHSNLTAATAEPKKRSRAKSARGGDGGTKKLEGRSEKVR